MSTRPAFDGGSGRVGYRNGYRCVVCGQITVTVVTHAGNTPVRIPCEMAVNCPGDAYSMWSPRGLPEPTHEWVKPTERELAIMDKDIVRHVVLGGLLLRKLPDPAGR